MPPPHVGRLRLAALCAAVACRLAAYTAVTVLCVSLLQGGHYAAYRPATLAAWLGLSAVPALVLAPFIGPLAGSRWNRAVRVGGTILVVAGLGWAWTQDFAPWLPIVGYLSLELAFFGTAVGALVPAVGDAARLRPTTARLALVASAALGVWFATVSHFLFQASAPELALGLAVAALLAVLAVDARPAEPVSLAQGIVKPFAAGVRDALGHRRARHALVGMWLWFFVALALVAALTRLAAPDGPDLDRLTRHVALAVVGGVVVTALNRHPYRHAGFVLYGAAVAAGCVLCLRFWDAGTSPLVGLGLALGLTVSPLLNFYFTWTSPRHHGIAAALVVAGWCAGALILAAVLFNLGENPAVARTAVLNVLLGVTALAVLAGLTAFFRPAMELTAETLLWPIYRIRAVGPGVEHLPTRGPYLVIGNHAGWFDPLFFAKVLPAPIVPMMTSRFYDLPVLSWIMRHVIGTIRVPDKPLRHEAPELKEAVAALDRGECVVLFPEGYLRRKEEVPLRRFGRGVWQILKDRPQTVVFACWIEGVWGSYLSYRGGPPTKGKRPDFWRPIRVGVVGPITVDAATLEDHMATRTYLMRQVAAARRPLGLDPVEVPAAHDADGEKE
jgi:1-acyl-sn-glycerol-3-phosphate acyltransferase